MSLHKALTLLLAAGLFFSACKKPVLEGTGLLPQDNLNAIFTDTLTVKAYTVREDSLQVGGGALSPLGIMIDPDFGITSASFYIPFLLPETNLTLLDGPLTLDSIVLSLRYSSIYGEWRDAQIIEVYEMSEGINDSVTYFSNQTFAVHPVPIATVNYFIPNVNDSLTVDGSRVPPVLRIKLDTTTFGQKFIDASGTSHYENNANFRQFFKGLYITGSRFNAGKGLVFFNPGSTFTEIKMYYRTAQGSTDSETFKAARLSVVNHFSHNYSGPPVEPFIQQANTIHGDSLVFIQGLAGLNTKFIIPNLDNLGNILVNKAEIVFTQVIGSHTDTTAFKAPDKLILNTQQDGKFTSIIDVSPATLTGGEKRVETDTLTNERLIRYRFSVSRYYQQVVSGITEDNGIFILPDARSQSAGRLTAGGTGHSKYAIKLNLTYTKVP